MSKYRDRKTRSFRASLSQHKGDRAAAQRGRLGSIASVLRQLADYPHNNYPEPEGRRITWESETGRLIGSLRVVRSVEVDRDSLIDLRLLVDALTEIAHGADANVALGVSRGRGERPRDYKRDRAITLDVINEHTKLRHLEDNNKESGALSVVAGKHGLSPDRVRQIYTANKDVTYEQRIWNVFISLGRWLNSRGIRPEAQYEYDERGYLVGITLRWREADGTEHVSHIPTPKPL